MLNHITIETSSISKRMPVCWGDGTARASSSTWAGEFQIISPQQCGRHTYEMSLQMWPWSFRQWSQLLPHTWLRSSLSSVLFVMKRNFRGDSLQTREMLRHTGVQVFLSMWPHSSVSTWKGPFEGVIRESWEMCGWPNGCSNPNAVRKLRDNSCSIFILFLALFFWTCSFFHA